jgi:hypothetical protein
VVGTILERSACCEYSSREIGVWWIQHSSEHHVVDNSIGVNGVC